MKLSMSERQLGLPFTGASPRRVFLSARSTRLERETALPPMGEVDRSLSTSGKEFRDYQVEACEWLKRRPRALLGDEIGLGKSAELLRALEPKSKTIVVCPAYLRLNWLDETREWRRDLEPVLPPRLREPQPGEVLIVSYESLPPPPPGVRLSLAPELSLRSVTLIADEAQYAKNPRAARTQRVKRLATQCGRVWPATGTPLLGSPPDLRGVLETFGLFRESYGDHANFLRVFQAQKKQVRPDRFDPVSQLVVPGLCVTEYGDALPEARELLAKVMLRRLRRDHLSLPPVIDRTIRVPAPEDLRKELDEALGAWQSWGDPNDLPPFELLSPALAALAKSRIPFLREHVEHALREGPLLVFSAFRAPVEALAALPRTRVVTGELTTKERHALCEAFQRGELDCLAATIDALGMGVTLTRAGRVVLADEDYTPAMNDQPIGRALRHGQTQSVLVERLVSDHPLDLRRQEILQKKMKLIGEVVGS